LTVWGVFSGRHEERSTRLVDRYGKPYAEARSGGIEGMSKVVLMFAFAERLELHALVKRVAETCKAMKVDRLLIESKASGISVAQEMRRLYGHERWAVHLINPGAQDKMARLYSVQHLFSEGMIFAPDKKWAEEVIRQVASFPKAKHDDLCLVAGTLVATKRGRVPIEEVCVGDLALTPLGWRRVSAAGLTGWRAVTTAKGLTGTRGHPVFTLDEGFAPLDTISQASRTVGLGLCDLMKTMRLRTYFLTGSDTAGWGASGNTTSANPAVMQDERTPRGCTSLFGKSTTANQWAKVTRSITLTVTLLTLALKIWSAYRKTCIEDCLRSILIGKRSRKTLSISGLLRPRGISLMQVVRGIVGSTGPLLNKLCGQAGSACQKAKTALCSVCTPVSGVVICFIAGTCEKCFVLLRANPPNQNVHAERLKGHRLNGRISVDGVADVSAGVIKRQNFAACHARQQSTGPEKQFVFNLTVEGAHCYYANGVLVHNCDATSQAIRHLRDTGLLIRADERLAELADSMDYANIRTPKPLYDA
jgi:predicted phage terminase large subunit-like protein